MADTPKVPTAPSENGKPAATTAPPPGQVVIRRTPLSDGEANKPNLKRQIPAWFISAGVHVVLLALFMLYVQLFPPPSQASNTNQTHESTVKEEEPEDPNLVNPDIGTDPELPTAYDVDRIETESVPGPVSPDEAIGIPNETPAPPMTIAPPAGFTDGGLGGAPSDNGPNGAPDRMAGGVANGVTQPGFLGRSGSTKIKMLQANGGNSESEAAVARGLAWLARVQNKADGHWDMIEGSYADPISATALALLPFLAAGQTHKPSTEAEFAKQKYHDVVKKGLTYLIGKQKAGGSFGAKSLYGHAIATMALCEAYGMTSDPILQKTAQAGLQYIEAAQHSAGGWRYSPGQAGDTSVTGWEVQALKSGKLAKLQVKHEAMAKAGYFLDSVSSNMNSQYGYTGPGGTPAMTAVGLLCRQYMGWGPSNPALIEGVKFLNRIPPRDGPGFNIYYYYYATQVMHFYGGDDWKAWNPKMRDLLIKKQIKEKGPKEGSWDPDTTHTGEAGGRLCATCLSLLTLEVYYRHLPLYKRESNTSDLDR